MAIFDDKSVGGIIGKFDNAATPSDGQVLVYNSMTGKWEPGTPTAEASGSASGDIFGTYPGPITVAALRGRSLGVTDPSDGDVLTYDGDTGKWEPAAAGTSSGSSGSYGLGDLVYKGYIDYNDTVASTITNSPVYSSFFASASPYTMTTTTEILVIPKATPSGVSSAGVFCGGAWPVPGNNTINIGIMTGIGSSGSAVYMRLYIYDTA